MKLIKNKLNKKRFQLKKKAKKIIEIYKNVRHFSVNKKFKDLITKFKLNKKKYFNVTVKVTANNLFCTLRKKNKTLIVQSAGKKKIKITKRKLRFNNKFLIKDFIFDLRKTIKKKKKIFITISGPVRIRKFIARKFITALKRRKHTILIQVKALKCFNGCRPAKKTRKKQSRFKIFKS